MSNPHMASFERNPQGLVDQFTSVMAGYADAPIRRTFGSPCAYINGNMAVGLHGDAWFVRLPPAEAADLLAIDGAAPFSPMPGRPMTGYVVLPASVLDDRDQLAYWIERSLDFCRSLPPKATAKGRG